MFVSLHFPHSLIVVVKHEQVEVQVLALKGRVLATSTLLARGNPLARASMSKISGADTIWNCSSRTVFTKRLESRYLRLRLLPELKGESDCLRGRARPTSEDLEKMRSLTEARES